MIFGKFGRHFGSQDGANINEKRCSKNDEKMMMTKMAKKVADRLPRDHSAPRFGSQGRRGGVNRSSRKFDEVGRSSWKLEVARKSKTTCSPEGCWDFGAKLGVKIQHKSIQIGIAETI